MVFTVNGEMGQRMDDHLVGATDTMTAKNLPVIELRDVYKVFVSGEKKDLAAFVALKQADFTVPEGEFLTIVGPSGCGKSTVLNMVSGLIQPTSGCILYKGKEVQGINTKIGYVTQDDNLLPWRTVLKNVEFSLEVRNVPKKERRERALRAHTPSWLGRLREALPSRIVRRNEETAVHCTNVGV